MSTTQEPQGIDSSAATEPSSHEWADQADAFFGGSAQPTGGDSTSTSTPPAKSQAAPAPSGNPLARWALNLARGPVDAVNALGRTAAELSVKYHNANPAVKTAVRNVPIVGQAMDVLAERVSEDSHGNAEEAKKVSFASEDEIESVYGPKPQDLVGGLLHGTSQFVTGQLLYAPLAGFGAIGGALSMGTAFDPYEKTLANWAQDNEKVLREKLPFAGAVVANAGKLLATSEKDGPIEARIKKAVEGEIVGKLTGFLLRPVTKALGWGYAKSVAAKAGDNGALERANAELARIHAANKTDVVEVIPSTNGRFVVQPRQTLQEPLASNGGRPSTAVNEFQNDLDVFFGNQPGEPRFLRARGELAGTADELAQETHDITRYRANTQALAENGNNVAERAAESARMAERGDAIHRELLHRRTSDPVVEVQVVSKGGDVAEIRNIKSLKPGEGYGSEVMQKITQLADQRGVTLTLQASPFGEGAMSPERLRNFYRKFGFEQVKSGDAQMVRRPGTTPTEFRESPVRGTPEQVPNNTVEVMKRIKELGLEGEVRAEAKMRNPTPEASDIELAARTVLKDHLDRSAIKSAGVRTEYSSEAAARSDAASMNGVAYELDRSTSMFTPEELVVHQQTVEGLERGDIGALTSNPHFNLQSMGTSEAVDAQINALSAQYGDMLSVAQGRPSVPNEVLHNAAAKWASQVHLDKFLDAMTKADAAGRTALSLKAALYNAAMKQAGQEVAEIGMLLRAKPGDEGFTFLARRRLETFLRVSEATANFNSELGRGLQALSARDTESAARIRFGSEVEPRPEIMTPKGAPLPPAFDPQRLSPAQLGSMLRLFERSGGDVRVVAHVVGAMQKSLVENKAAWEQMSNWDKNVNQLVTVFINSIISGFKTAGTIATSGAAMNAFRASAKIAGGVGTLNRGLAEEGAAQLYALVRYAKENMRGSWGAFMENRSIIDGTPPYHVDPSPVMKFIQVPGRVAGSLDEFTRVAAYRADEFSAAFRQARNDGLSLADAARRAEFDVSMSVDKNTGIGLNPLALKRAGIPTLSDNLGSTTFMGKLSNAVADYPLTKLVVPFIRPSVNTFRFAHANTPLLNRFSRDAQAIYLEGGEALTTLHAQSTAAGAMMVYSMSKWMDGEITGAGPRDPQLRAEWAAHHQPYSVKINGQWHSYRRYEPFATFLGSVADGMEYYHEIPDEDKDTMEEKATGALAAVFAATARNTTSKSWTESLLTALTALDDKDDNAWRRYIVSTASGLVPYSAFTRQFNPDPVWREVRSVLDGVKAQIPGWSETLPARYDWSGKVVAKQGSMWNRNFALATEMDASPSVEDKLVDNYIRLSQPNPRPYKGIDMWDPKWTNADGKVPYQVFMEKLAATGVRKMVEDKVKEDDFLTAPQGNASYPESLRGDIIQAIVGAQTQQALNDMLTEFEGQGGFAEAYRQAKYVTPLIAKYEGQEAADSAKRANNTSTNIKR